MPKYDLRLVRVAETTAHQGSALTSSYGDYRLNATKVLWRVPLPSRRRVGDALSPKHGFATRSTPMCPHGLASEDANDGCRCARPAHARYERQDRADGTPRGPARRRAGRRVRA